MSFFRRQPKGLLPPNIVTMMERFGRHEIDVRNSADDGYAVWQTTQEPLLAAATDDPAGVIAALADACVPEGGWAAYGADRTVVNLVGISPPGEAWLRILDASNDFLRANHVPPMRVPPYAWRRFIETGGTANTWLQLRPAPDRGSVPLVPLMDGETRRLVKMDPDPNSNVIYVRRDGEDLIALIDARWSDEDPTRSQSEWKRATAQYDLYLDIAWSTQVWDWAAPEIEPFFPTPKALI